MDRGAWQATVHGVTKSRTWLSDWASTFVAGEIKISVQSVSIVAAAKLLQSCPTLCNPIDSSPPGSPVPGILQARTLEWGAIAFSDCLCRAQEILVYQTFAFHLHVSYLSPRWIPKSPYPASSFVSSWRWFLRLKFPPFRWVTQFSWVSPMHTCSYTSV